LDSLHGVVAAREEHVRELIRGHESLRK
jgi:hypothetical protein